LRVLSIVHEPTAGPGVFAEVWDERGAEVVSWRPPEEAEAPALDGLTAILAFGGAMHVDQEDRHPWLTAERELLAAALEHELPVLAVCLASQLLAQAAGGSVARGERAEIGWHDVLLSDEGEADPVLGPLAPGFEAFQWHAYEFQPPEDAAILAFSDGPMQAFRVGKHAWGIQFHAEVSRADALAWIDDAASDPDAVAAEIDAEALRDQTDRRIDGWNQTGRALCARFLEAAATRE
jgi:GMP synthase-like glutamine amidotransferase